MIKIAYNVGNGMQIEELETEEELKETLEWVEMCHGDSMVVYE